MATFDDQGLVLATYPYGDRHLVVCLLTRAHGNLRAVLRGARGGKTPLSGATQILSRVRVTVYQPPHSELASLRHLELERSSFPLASSLASASAAAVVAELLATFCPQGEAAERPYRLGAAALDALLAGAKASVAVAYVQYWVLSLGGVLPPLDRCTCCGAATEAPITIRPGDGQPLCRSCLIGTADSLDLEAVAFLSSCRQLPVAKVETCVPSNVARWLDRLVTIEAERPLRALEFLRKHGTEDP